MAIIVISLVQNTSDNIFLSRSTFQRKFKDDGDIRAGKWCKALSKVIFSFFCLLSFPCKHFFCDNIRDQLRLSFHKIIKF